MKTAMKITFVLCIAVIFTAMPNIVLAQDPEAQETAEEGSEEGKSRAIEGVKKGIEGVKKGYEWTAPVRQKIKDKYEGSELQKGVNKGVEVVKDEAGKVKKAAGDAAGKQVEKVNNAVGDAVDDYADKKSTQFYNYFIAPYVEFPLFVFTGRTSAQATFIIVVTLLLIVILYWRKEEWKPRYIFFSYIGSRILVLISCEYLGPVWNEEVQALVLLGVSGVMAIPLAVIFVIFLFGLIQAIRKIGTPGIMLYLKGEPIIAPEPDPEPDPDPDSEPDSEPDSDSDPDSEPDPVSSNFDLKKFKNR